MRAVDLKANLSWRSRIAAKIVLSRLPAGYAFWQRVGLFRHGKMDNADYAMNVFDRHVTRSGLQGRLAGTTILEIGPGDSVATAYIAAAHGARAILIDAGRYAAWAPEVYRSLARRLRAAGLEPPDIGACRTLDDVLSTCGARYLTDGIRSFSAVASGSVDLIFSQAVLEHIRRNEFLDTQRESARILRRDGVCSHRVDLRDHLGGGLNNLRLPSRVWESEFFANSGFYTNRIQFGAICRVFEQAGFALQVDDVQRWKRVPIARRKLAREFRDLADSELNVSGFDIVLRHRAVGSFAASPAESGI